MFTDNRYFLCRPPDNQIPRRRDGIECLDWRLYGFSTFNECTDGKTYYDAFVEGYESAEDKGLYMFNRCYYAMEQLVPNGVDTLDILLELTRLCYMENGGTEPDCPSGRVDIGETCREEDTKNPITGETCSYRLCE